MVEEQGEGVVMMRWEETNLVQRWRLTTVAEDRPGLLVNVATGRLLTIADLSQFNAGQEEDKGVPAALDRGWSWGVGRTWGSKSEV